MKPPSGATHLVTLMARDAHAQGHIDDSGLVDVMQHANPDLMAEIQAEAAPTDNDGPVEIGAAASDDDVSDWSAEEMEKFRAERKEAGGGSRIVQSEEERHHEKAAAE